MANRYEQEAETTKPSPDTVNIAGLKQGQTVLNLVEINDEGYVFHSPFKSLVRSVSLGNHKKVNKNATLC